MYIKAAAAISPQVSFEQILQSPASYNSNRLNCAEPDYTKLFDARIIRRMSRIIKMGVATAKDCLHQADVQSPGAIITGTAYGCLADTELFLSKMVENKEELLTPTAFIQSTHNTVGAQIALMLKCHNYNNTFVHRGFSFESAMLDAITLLHENAVEDVLVGGVDEITDTSHTLLSRFGLYKQHAFSNLDLYNNHSKGTIAGEGAGFFLLSKKTTGNSYAKLDDMATLYKPSSPGEVAGFVNDFLHRNNIRAGDIGLLVSGENGDAANDKWYADMKKTLFNDTATQAFKHFCGEYPTAPAFALWLAANIMKTGKIPAHKKIKAPGKILIYNHYLTIHHSLYLLSAC
ncbi:beta-ketoacyl synthase [Terrimonas sp.]|uniref:beta-ketoacyl synthase chain length factor n=1 Tax=Terrimonas sp. TaxID=1914338 RepID=UPI000D5107F7|nr:beta-ketoacyl synthase chain length factor [Terrimonas sp.]PVD49780.1 beta-ketoacyl synthase [Terrimonas sp.]